MMQCIYCVRNLPAEAFRTTEHIVPQCMGTFLNNLTLNGVVCDDCNRYFGETIDLMLGRGSVEAVRRFDYDVQPISKVKHIRKDRVSFSLKSQDAWNGVLLEIVPEGGRLAVKWVPQVGFKRSSKEDLTFVSEETLARDDIPLPPGPYPDGGILLVADSDATEERLIAALQKRGVVFRRQRQEKASMKPEGMLEVEVRARCDRMVLRCIAKIALNHLAYCEGSELVLQEAFGPIRRFVRSDEHTSYPLVVVDNLSILADDLPHLRQTNGHIVTAGWATDRRSIVGQVSLFNHARYRVSLARDYPGIWRPIHHGHHFNIESGKVTPLVASSLAK